MGFTTARLVNPIQIGRSYRAYYLQRRAVLSCLVDIKVKIINFAEILQNLVHDRIRFS